MQGWDAAMATLFLFQLECLPGTKGLVLLCPKDSRGCLRHPSPVVPGESPRRDPFTRGRHQGEEVGLVVGKKIILHLR